MLLSQGPVSKERQMTMDRKERVPVPSAPIIHLTGYGHLTLSLRRTKTPAPSLFASPTRMQNPLGSLSRRKLKWFSRSSPYSKSGVEPRPFSYCICRLVVMESEITNNPDILVKQAGEGRIKDQSGQYTTSPPPPHYTRSLGASH